MKKKKIAGSVAKLMVENRRQFAPRIVENKRRKAMLSPKHRLTAW